jgi:hypothetical protein
MTSDILKIPNELLVEIVNILELKDLLSFITTNKQLENLDKTLQWEKYFRDFSSRTVIDSTVMWETIVKICNCNWKTLCKMNLDGFPCLVRHQRFKCNSCNIYYYWAGENGKCQKCDNGKIKNENYTEIIKVTSEMTLKSILKLFQQQQPKATRIKITYKYRYDEICLEEDDAYYWYAAFSVQTGKFNDINVPIKNVKPKNIGNTNLFDSHFHITTYVCEI